MPEPALRAKTANVMLKLSDRSEASLRALSTANSGIKVLEKGRKMLFAFISNLA